MTEFRIIKIDANGVQTEVASDLEFEDAVVRAMLICTVDFKCLYQILDPGGHIVFESFNKSARGTRGFKIYKEPRSKPRLN